MTTTPQAALLSDDLRTLGKWLNEEITAPIDRPALARVLHALQATQADHVPDAGKMVEPVQAGELPDERARFCLDNILRKLDGLISNINEIHTARTDSERNELVREANVNRQFLIQMITRAALSARKPLTRRQINEASRDAQISFCLKSGGTYEEELARAIERAHGIGLEVKP